MSICLLSAINPILAGIMIPTDWHGGGGGKPPSPPELICNG